MSCDIFEKKTGKIICLSSLILCFLITSNCGSFQNQRSLRLSSDKLVTVQFEIRFPNPEQRILFVEYLNENQVRKEATIEKEVLEIWEQLRSEAETKGIDEGLIQYSFPDAEDHEHKDEKFLTVLFTADQIENGSWSIKRVK